MVQSGIKSDLIFDGFGKNETQIINQLACVWFITFARKTNFKLSEYTYVFLKPTNEIQENFHLDREVLVIFSKYPDFDTRALDYVDKTMTDFQNRLDKLCVLVISPDESVISKIKSRAIQDKELRIVIPFTYREFNNALTKNNTKDFIANRMREYLYNRDLFAFDSPLKSDTYFFGRSQIVQHLYGKYKAGENSCLFGLRKIGKTSVLYAVKRYVDSNDEIATFIDCSEPSMHQRRWNHSLHFIISNLCTLLGNRISPADIKEYSEENASMCFENDLLRVSTLIKGKRILLIFDEVENLTFEISPSENWSKGMDSIYFWQTIRSIFQKNDDLFCFLIAGVNPKITETATFNGFDNPLYRMIKPVYLELFDVKNVKEMVSTIGNYMGLSFEEEIFTYLEDDFGGHPFIIRYVCSQISKDHISRPAIVTRFYYQSKREEFNSYIQEYIDLIISILRERYRLEYELLEYLAQGHKDVFFEYASTSNILIEHLVGYGLIKCDDGNYYFTIKAVKDYIISRTKVTKLLSTQEEKRTEVSRRRNNIEIKLRKVLKQVLVTHHGKKIREKLLEKIPHERRDLIISESDEEILNNKLYFSDLIAIIGYRWSEFSHIFGDDKDRFLSDMEIINKYRIDAHAKGILDDDLDRLLFALDKIGGYLNQFLE